MLVWVYLRRSSCRCWCRCCGYVLLLVQELWVWVYLRRNSCRCWCTCCGCWCRSCGCGCTYGGTVVVVCVRVMIVRVHAGQHGAAGRAAHWRRYEGVVEVGAAVLKDPARFRHVVQRPCNRQLKTLQGFNRRELTEPRPRPRMRLMELGTWHMVSISASASVSVQCSQVYTFLLVLVSVNSRTRSQSV